MRRTYRSCRNPSACRNICRSRGVIADLVIINERTASYAQDMQHAIDFMCENARRRGLSSGPAQHIFSVRKDLMDQRAYDALISAGRIVLHTRNGAISEQIERLERLSDSETETSSHAPWWRRGRIAPAGPVADKTVSATICPCGTAMAALIARAVIMSSGQWRARRRRSPGSRDLQWRLRLSHRRRRRGLYLERQFARDYQLTPWSNDAVVNRPSEAFYIRDLSSDRMFSPLPPSGAIRMISTRSAMGPAGRASGWRTDGLDIVMTQIVAESDPAKLMRSASPIMAAMPERSASTPNAEWVLGNNRVRTAPYIRAWHEESLNALMAQNPFRWRVRRGHRFSPPAARFSLSPAPAPNFWAMTQTPLRHRL